MPMFEWNSSLSVNVKHIDEQHQKLIDIINKLYEAMKIGKANTIVAEIVKELADYTIYHFGEEEKYMASIKYPDLPAHKVLHEKFVQKVIEYQEKINAGKTLLIGMELANFLKDWLINHINQTDKKYSTYHS